MNRKTGATIAIGILLTLTCVEGVLGQAPSGPPKPGPDHEKLAFFAGKWTSEGETKASAFGPAGKFTFTETCEWFAASGFALVCHSEGNMLGGTVKGLSIMGYDLGDKTYTYYETNTMGENIFSRGTVEGDTWTWTNDEKMGNTTMKGRFIMKLTSATSYTFTFELSPDGTKWNTIMDGKASKEK